MNSPNVDNSSSQHRASLDPGIYQLFDKYLKSNDNYLPLKAYLESVEYENYDEFSLISNVKLVSSDSSSLPPPPVNPSVPSGRLNAPTPFTTSLNLFKKHPTNELQICQKLYKVVISIDYAPSTTSLDYIQKSLEIVFEKIAREYEEFYEKCYATEPQIYVTCLLWNMAYFYTPRYSAANVVVDENLTPNLQCHNLAPFTIIAHSKRLLKSNINDMARFLFAKINEAKTSIIESALNSGFNSESNFMRFNSVFEGEYEHRRGSNVGGIGGNHHHRSKSPFDEFLRIIMRIFEYFCINEVNTSQYAPTALACSHHIHITDGVINATDITRCVDKLSRTAITYSFIYSGCDNWITGSNISSSFGHLADYSLMKFIAYTTGGFYMSVDDNLVAHTILNQRLFYYYSISTSQSQSQSQPQPQPVDVKPAPTSPPEASSKCGGGQPVPPTNSYFNSCDENEIDESRDYFNREFNSIKFSDKISSMNSRNSKRMRKASHKDASVRVNEPGSDIWQLLYADLALNDQMFEFKCIQSYELAQRASNANLLQLFRVRAQEGFYLVRIAHDSIKSNASQKGVSSSSKSSQSPSKKSSSLKPSNNYVRITLYFKKYFTQTLTIIYKVSYVIARATPKSENPTTTATTVSNDPPSGDSGEQVSITPTKSSRTQAQQSSGLSNKLNVEIWLSWNFLHLRARYQNLDLMKRAKTFLNNIHSAESESSLELTQAMLNPPEILKDPRIKEPLFKELTSNTIVEDEAMMFNESFEIASAQQQHPESIIKHSPVSIYNLKFELNSCLAKMVEKDFFHEFANAWKYLAFFKFNKSVQNRLFCSHSIRLVLDHDRPMPDMNQVLFDLKNTMMLQMLEQQQQQQQIQQQIQMNQEANDGMSLSVGVGNRYSVDYLTTNLNIATSGNNQEQVIININHSSLQNSIFSCVNSMNRLRTMLTEWCDVVLVENCVFVKFLVSSVKYNRRKLVEMENSKKQTQSSQADKTNTSGVEMMSTVSEHPNSSSYTSETSIGGGGVGGDNKQSEMASSPSSTSAMAANDAATNIATVSSNSPATPSNTSTGTPTKSGVPSTNTTAANNANNSANTTTNSLTSSHSKNSFVMIKLDYQYVPFVSLQFLFHSNISYMDRTRIVEKFKSKINEFKCVPPLIINNNSSMAASPNLPSVATANSLLLTPTSSIYSNVQSAAAVFAHRPSNVINLSFDENQQLQQTQRNLNSSSIQSAKMDINKEFCHLLHKPELYDAFRYALLEDVSGNIFTRQQDNLLGEIGGHGSFHPGSKSINFMHQKRYRWKLNKQFSFNTAQTLKETIIDTLVRTRLKEGFKCLFRKPKLVVFTLQLTMFDSGDVSTEPTTTCSNAASGCAMPKSSSSANLANSATNAPSKQPDSASSAKQVRGSSQICTFIYVIRFANNVNLDSLSQNYDYNNGNNASKLGNRQGLLNIANGANPSMMTSSSEGSSGVRAPEEEVYFQTEIYCEAIDGIFQERKSAVSSIYLSGKRIKEKSAIDYFKSLNTLEICNLIYLIDLKCFSSLQSIYSLFLSKSNSILNLNSLMLTMSSMNTGSSSDAVPKLEKSGLLSDFSTDVINNILAFNVNFVDSVRLLPDVTLVLKKHSLKESRHNSSGSFKPRFGSTNLHHRIRFNQPKGLSTTPGNELNSSNPEVSPISSSLEEQQQKEAAAAAKKPKKPEILGLQEQLRPLLNSLDIWSKPHINIDFDFTLRGILLESALYVVVFEDIPFNLWSTTNKQASASTAAHLAAVKKIQQYFLASINEQFKHLDPTDFGASSTATPMHQYYQMQHQHFYQYHAAGRSHATQPTGGTSSHHYSQQSSEEQAKTYDGLVESMKSDVKNAIALKLNDIKSGDSIVKQIIDHLKKTAPSDQTQEANNRKRTTSVNESPLEDESQDFKVYIKFQVVQSTAKQNLISPSSAASGVGGSTTTTSGVGTTASGTQSTNTGGQPYTKPDLFRHTSTSSANTFIQHAADIDSNKFFVYGLFFLNTGGADTSSNRLVFFLFNCMPEHIKNSLIQTQTNTYLIRKFLFPSSSSSSMAPSSSRVDFTAAPSSKASASSSNQDPYKFYPSKNSRRSMNYGSGSSKNLIKKAFSISDILLRNDLFGPSLSSNLNDSYLLAFLNRIEERCARFYIKSLIHYLATCSIGKMAVRLVGGEDEKNKSEEEQAECFDKRSINQLLKMGTKIKLTDLDLTEYFRLICVHLNQNQTTPQSCKEEQTDANSSLEYLERKFEEIFLKRFHVLPGFNDLFVFTSLMKMARDRSIEGHHRQSEDTPIVTTTSANTDLDEEDEENLLDDGGNSDELDSDHFENFSSETDSSSNFEEDALSVGGGGNGSSGVGATSTGVADSESELSSVPTTGYYDESDSNEPQAKLVATSRTSKSSKLRRLKNLKSSSPYSSATSVLNRMRTKLSRDDFSGVTGTSSLNEKIIGLEMVCVINNEQIDFADLDMSESRTRTRTTTLTADNISLDYFQIDNIGITGQSESSGGAPLIPSGPTPSSQQQRKFTFTSKFNKFNCACIFDLIEEKDMAEFSSILAKIEAQANSSSIGDATNTSQQQHLFNDIKIYLRFNWYSFNDLTVSSSNMPFGMPSSTSKQAAQVSKPLLFAASSSQQVNQSSNYPFVRPPSENSNSNSSLLYLATSIGQSTKLPTPNNTLSTHSSTSTVYNQPNASSSIQSLNNNKQRQSHLNQMLNQKFEYNHILSPSLREFKWHLRDEIFQMQKRELKNMKSFYKHMEHIRRGCTFLTTSTVNHKCCHIERKKIVLSRTTVTTTTSLLDAPPKTNASKLPGASKQKKTQSVEEDPTIISVDMVKFFSELAQLVRELETRLFNSKLQQMNVQHGSDLFYYLRCNYDAADDLAFKIMIHVKCETLKTIPQKTSPSSSQMGPPSLQSQTSITGANDTTILSRSPATYLHPSNAAARKPSIQQVEITKPGSQQIPQAHHPPQLHKPTQVTQETITNQLKIKIYFGGFNHSGFESKSGLVDQIINEFNVEFENIIRLSYLKLALKDIHENRKWNNLLQLKESAPQETSAANSGPATDLAGCNLDSSITSLDNTFSSTGGLSSAGLNKQDTESMGTLKNMAVLNQSPPSSSHPLLVCNCVWSTVFKLHRLHQTLQKVHDPISNPNLLNVGAGPASSQINTTIASTTTSNQQAAQLAAQQYISQGLNKLRESLVNFRIEESSNCGDLYVYTNKKQIYLLKLEEIYDTSSSGGNAMGMTPNALSTSQQNQSLLTTVSSSSMLIDNDNETTSLDLNERAMQRQGKLTGGGGVGLSRRPSHASISDAYNDVTLTSSTSKYPSKSQNLSGGVVQATASLTNAVANQALQPPRNNPEYIRLSVYGLQEPDDEMKNTLCRTLQAELDYWLLIRMCNSIEKNTYKTTSAQHPDKITDEDLVFFKQICDNYFEYELPLPFVFNFNRTLRENFFYFVKQMFNSNFKSIDAPPAYNLPGYVVKRSNSETKSTPADRSEEITVGSDSQSNASVLTQQLSYSLMSSQPTTVSFDSTARPMSRVASTASTIAGSRKQSSLQQVINEQQQDPFSILLTRIFFHNSKHNRIGKHNVALVLVEALYSIKGLDYLVSSKITRSNSIGAAGVIGYSASQQAPLRSGSLTGSNQTQILETSRTRCRQIGPTFVFRFYCRGESSEFTAYKNALKSALNDALLLFLSEYMTRVDASLYMKRIDLKKKPPAFRVIQNYAKQTSEIGPTTVTTTTTTGDTVSSSSRDATAAFQQQLIDEDERMKLRKRHKSTGHVAYTSDSRSSSAVSTCVLKMNKSALKTRLGRLLLSQNIRDENQLNAFIFANFSKNLFDHKDYEDTLEYFRESIRPFEYSRIVNQIVSNRVSDMSSSIGELFHRIGSVSDEELTGDAAHSDSDRSSCSSGAEEDEESIVQGETATTTTSTGPTITTTDEQLSSASNSSSTSSLSSLLVQGSVAAEAAAAGKQGTTPTESSSNVVTATKKKSTTPSRLYRKSHLRIIYEWLKGLYYIQSRGSVNICSKSTGSMQTLIGTSSFSNIIQRVPSSTYLSSQTSNPGQTAQTQQQQQQQQHQPQQSPNPALSSLLSITQTPSFILRKQFNFYSKYNLINFLRDLENSLRDFIKTDINACYFTFKKSGVVGGVSRQATTTDEVFDDEHLFLRQQQKDTPLSLKPNWNDLQFADEFDHDFDFANLKRTRFNLLHDALSRSENLVVTINAEYNPVIVAPSNLASSNSTVASSGLGSSMSQPIPSSTTATAAPSTSTGASYNRVPSFGSARDKEQQSQKLELATSNNSLSTSTSNTATMVTPNASQQQQHQQQIMIKSMTSTSGGTGGAGGDLESSMSSQQQQQLQTPPPPPPPQSLKRTFCYILVNAKSRKVTFYCFTTEPACYDSIKQFLDQSAELIAQRHTLVNNIVLYKLGGLIGDCLMYDIKKVKQSAMSGGSSICNSSDLTSSLESPNSDFKFIKPTPQQIIVQQQQQQASALKMSKSPTMLRQLSLGKGLANINPNIITSLQFSSSNSPQSGANSSSTATSCQTTTTGTTVQTPALQSQQSQQLSANSIRQLFLSHFNDKFYDSIVNIINQQALFCSLYLSATLTSTSTASSSLTQSLLQQQQSLELPSNQPLTLSFNAANTIHRQTTQMAQLTNSNNNLSTSTIFNPSRASFLIPTGVNMTSLQQTALGLYGVGLCYQLYEMQQIYRHPRKIYEIAVSLGSCQQTSGAGQARGSIAGGTLSGSQGVAGSTPTTSSPVIKSQMPTVNEFYKNFVQPVLVPFHYCCTPLLFYPNWHDTMVTENMLRTGTTFVKPKSSSDSSSSTTASSSTAKTAGSGATSSDSWYYKMRQIILVEYARYFEARGFIRLKDEPKPTAASSSNRMQQQQQQHSATNNLENQTFHFIRWIQQDGFLYITMNIEEIYLCVKLGYCTRYRSTSRLAFMNEMIRFFTHEFHLHSFIYDVHLAAINTNFLNSVLVPQIAPIISKFLDEFVEFFDRIPAYSSNKVYKLIHEKRDSSLIPHQFSLIFDLLIDSRKKMAAAASNNNDLELNVNLSSSLTLKILFLFGNSIAIYSLIDNTKPSSEQQSSKFLVIKIESFTKETTTTINQTAGLSTTPSFNSPSTMENSVIMGSSRQPSERQFLRSSHRLTTSSSSSSLPVTPEQQNVYGRKKASNPVTTQTPVKKLEPFIRVTCYYIYINKNPTVGLSSGAHQSATSSSLGSSNLVNAISSDLEYINKVIEESINAYKMEIFWDNLTSSMYSIKSMLNDDKPSTSASSPTSPPISFEVNSDELEQILNISQKINILELDPSLDSLMNSCYLIRDKIKDHLAPAFGRHYIFTQSNTVEYAILLINDELIRNFRHNEATNEKPNESSNEQKQLKSFILLEFDRQAKTSRLLQVNRVKTDRQQESRHPPKRSTTVDAIASSIAASTASSNLPSTSDQTMASSLKSESQIAGPSSILSPTFVVSSSSTLNNRPIHRYLSFTVNFLICVLWESLFSNT